ncbi:MAG: hypothetical protein V7K41_22280 [Nostoc sp.]|uniref:hypothetical protein n=1 Tax=Nostoc sp. TaxID=1180 RepID=UPI002FF7B8A5
MTTISYCVNQKSTVEFQFNSQQKQIYQSESGVNVTTITPGSNNLLKCGKSVKVPNDWTSVEIWLYGIVFIAPSYPDCPSTYYELLVGTATPNQTLTLIETARLDVCTNAHIMSIPELGYSNFERQWNGGTVGIGLKGNTDKCTIQIIDSMGRIFSKTSECPIKYTVACGDDCPEGFCKCEISEYPGYCCLNCNATARSIRDITNNLRVKNYG